MPNGRGFGRIYQRGTIWWIKFYKDGQAFRESSKSTDPDDAERLLRRRTGDRDSGRPCHPRFDRLRFKEAAGDLENEYQRIGLRSSDELERRLRLHLLPFFGNRRMVMITPADVTAYVVKRQADTVRVRKARRKKTRKGWLDTPEERRPVSAGEINRELTTLKRVFSLAIENGKLLHKPIRA